MAYRFICYGKNLENLNVTLSSELVGSKFESFCEQISSGDKLFLYVNSRIFALVEVVGAGFKSNEVVWKDKLYPFRFKIRTLKRNSEPDNFLNTPFKDSLYEMFGKGWGYKFLYSPKEIPPEIGMKMEDQLFNDKNSLKFKLQKEENRYV